MPSPLKSTPDDDADQASPRPFSRRTMLTFVIGAPILTVGASWGVDAVAPVTASAAIPSNPDPTDLFDIGDAITAASLPTMPLVVLKVGEDGRVRLELPRLEMGQGLDTACAIMVAEELDVPVGQVDVPLSDARPELLFNQQTGGSCNVRTFNLALPAMAATARARLLLAAAQRWGVPVAGLTTKDGSVFAPDGRSAGYGSLSAAAASVAAPSGVAPKPPSAQSLIGRPQPRLDALAAVTGRKRFTMDTQVPGAKPTMVRRPPTIRGTVVSVNNAAAVEAMPGVLGVAALPAGGRVVPIPPGVAVVAETFEQARAAVNALDVTWGKGTVDGENNDTILAKLKQSILPFALPPLGALTVEAEFDWAPACHAPMESECAIADVRADGAEIWGGLQAPIVAQQALASDLGLSQNQVKVHVVPAGGGFGRKYHWDAAQQAAQASKLFGRPVKLMYHRTDDMRHTRLRPPTYTKLRATVVAGQVVALEQRTANPAIDLRFGLGEIMTATATAFPQQAQQSIGNAAFEVAAFTTMVSSPYNFGITTKECFPVDIPMSTGAYRSVPVQPARGPEEILVDEIAAKLGKDPVDFRLAFLRAERSRAVLRKVAEVGGWGKRMPAGFAQGVGSHTESRAHTACLVEIDCRNLDAVRVTKAVIAIDVGKPINPMGIEAQMQGGLAEAISLTLTAGIHIRDGLPLEGSYSQYHFARQKNFPTDVQVIVCPRRATRWAEWARSACRRPPGRSPTPTGGPPESRRVVSRCAFPSTSPRSRRGSSPPQPSLEEHRDAYLRVHRQQEGRHRRRAGGHATAVGAARHARDHRAQIRLRDQRLQGLHQSSRRRSRPTLFGEGLLGRGSRGDDHRGIGRWGQAASRAAGMAGPRRRPMRLLPARSDHGRGRVAEVDAQPDGRADRRHRERLPLRHLLPHS